MTKELVADTPGTGDWVEVVHSEDGGYEWEFVGIWYSPSARRFFGYADAGCSCNWWQDGFSIANCEDGNKQWAIQFAKDSTDPDAEQQVRAFNTKTLS
ncbi:MAG TPA: hypothetical protein VHP34_02990 [Alphaproteobacteria bacterium]|nr:hypothetical protein [Alphaproteobacteria bacterium]